MKKEFAEEFFAWIQSCIGPESNAVPQLSTTEPSTLVIVFFCNKPNQGLNKGRQRTTHQLVGISTFNQQLNVEKIIHTLKNLILIGFWNVGNDQLLLFLVEIYKFLSTKSPRVIEFDNKNRYVYNLLQYFPAFSSSNCRFSNKTKHL